MMVREAVHARRPAGAGRATRFVPPRKMPEGAKGAAAIADAAGEQETAGRVRDWPARPRPMPMPRVRRSPALLYTGVGFSGGGMLRMRIRRI